VTKLNSTGTALLYPSFIGGDGSDSGSEIAIDGEANAYVTGVTSSNNFPTTLGAFQPASAGGYDAFVVKIVDVVLPPPPVTPPLPAAARQAVRDVITFSGGFDTRPRLSVK
jgi:beta-propeller repeat-containing protein